MLGIHNTLAASLSIPELEMEQDEAREISKAYADVAEYYPSMKMNGETAAVLNLAAILSVNYGARIMAYRMRRKSEKRPMKTVQSSPSSSTMHSTPIPPNMFTTEGPPNPSPAPVTEKPVMTKEVRTGEIPGVGSIEFPANHPLMGGAAKGNA